MKVREKNLRGCGLSFKEERVLRYFWNLPLCLKHKRWTKEMNASRFQELFLKGMEKIRDAARHKETKRLD